MECERAERCETCRFWDAENKYRPTMAPGEDGHCRRLPPYIVPRYSDAVLSNWMKDGDPWEIEKDQAEIQKGCWPITWSFDWCGEWKPKESPSGVTCRWNDE